MNTEEFHFLHGYLELRKVSFINPSGIKKAQRTISIDSIQIGRVLEEFNIDEAEHKREVLLKVLPMLKEKPLQLIEMRFFERRSFREIGEILGLTENNAKVKTFRALIKLKELYAQHNPQKS